ncbi:MAG: lipopolysaccharide biosynthesis protein [Armatimonadota bacterium]
MIANIVAAFIIRGGALVVSFFSLPVYIRYFNNQEALGVWYTVLSVLTWILSMDFGVGNGLRNKLVGAFVRKDVLEAKSIISSSYYVIGLTVVCVSTCGCAIAPMVDWNSVFSISPEVISQKTMLFVIICVFMTIMVQFLLRLISFVLYALQKSAVNNFLALVTSLLQLLFVVVYPSSDIETNIRMLSVVYFICVNVPLLCATILVFNFSNELKGCLPDLRFFSKDAAYGILCLGGVFFWNQIMYMLITGTNSLLITKFIGPGYVVDYQIYFRLFAIAGMLFTLALTPLWSAITKAFEEKNGAWIARSYLLTTRLVIIAVVCQCSIVPFLQYIVDFWLRNHSIQISLVDAVVFAVFGSVSIYQSVVATFACGFGKMKLQAVCYTAGVIMKLLLVYISYSYYKQWIVVVMADIIITLPYCIAEHVSIRKHIGAMNVSSDG